MDNDLVGKGERNLFEAIDEIIKYIQDQNIVSFEVKYGIKNIDDKKRRD